MESQQLKQLGLWEGFFFRWTRRFSRSFFSGILNIWCGLKIKGLHHITGLEQCIFAPTHASHLDFWAVLEGIDPLLVEKTYVAAAFDYFYQSPWRKLITNLISFHNFPFPRHAVTPATYRRLYEILRAGLSLLIFAQGSRMRDGKLLPFKPLLAMLAMESGIPLVPVAVQGTFAALPAGRWWPRRHPITVVFGEPIYPDRFRPSSSGRSIHKAVRCLNEELMLRIQRLWEMSEKMQ